MTFSKIITVKIIMDMTNITTVQFFCGVLPFKKYLTKVRLIKYKIIIQIFTQSVSKVSVPSLGVLLGSISQ